MDAFDISASALSAQRLRLDVIASNLANINTTRKADGSIGAYRKRNVVFASMLQNAMKNGKPGSEMGMKQPGGDKTQVTFQNGVPTLKVSISRQSSVQATGVQVTSVTEDVNTPLRKVYDPTHPDADKDGYVSMPNINPVSEMVDMIAASRAYEANVTAMQASKTMHKAALEI